MKASIDELSLFLLKQGFLVKTTRGCLDVLARKGSLVLLLKILKDANSIVKEHAIAMRNSASLLSASPLIIVEDERFSDGVVYTRFGICAVTFSTLARALGDVMPYIASERAGLTVRIIGACLHELRQQSEISLKMISEHLGISPRMVLKYEQESADVSLHRVSRLYDLFGSRIFRGINIFDQHVEPGERNPSGVSLKYEELGFTARETERAPFDVVARSHDKIILTNVGDRWHRDLTAIADLLEVDELIIFDHKRPKDIAAIHKQEFMGLERARDLFKILHEH